MDEFDFFMRLLRDGLAILGGYKVFKEIAPKIFANIKAIGKRTFYDASEVKEQFQNGNVSIGDLIVCEGFLSRYAQTFKPLTFTALIPGASKEEKKLTVDKDGKMVEGYTISSDLAPFQMPVNNIPPLSTGLGRMKCCFLYPSDFSSFVYPRSQKKASESYDKDLLDIPESSKPILVLLDENRFGKHLEKQVQIKGQLQLVPETVVKIFDGLYDATVRELLSNCYFPLEGRSSFICLSLLYQDSSVDVIKEEREEIPGNLFVEYHAENVQYHLREFDDFVGNSIPDFFDIKAGLALPGSKVRFFITKGKVKFLYRKPNVFGFYVHSNLSNNADLVTKLASLREFTGRFSRKLKEQAKEKMSIDLEMRMDFVFDYTKKFVIDPRGSLNSMEIETIAKANQEIKETVDWLKES
jgi:hypothetical protein